MSERTQVARAGLKVLHFIPGTEMAGTEVSVVTLATALKQRGVEVLIACTAQSPVHQLLRTQGVRCVPLTTSSTMGLGSFIRLVALIKSERVSVVHAHLGGGYLAIIAGRLCHVPAVFTQHFVRPAYATSRSRLVRSSHRLAHRLINSQTDRIIAVSNAVKTGMTELEKVDSKRVVTIPNGVMVNRFLNASPLRAYVKKNTSVVATVARLLPEKGIEYLLQAAVPITKHCPDTEFLIVGTGAHRRQMEEIACDLGISTRVKFLGFRSDIPQLLASADVFVLPSLEEPFGIVLLEAMAAGLPVIATRAGGPMEIVVDGETGLLVPPRDADSLANAILSLLSSRDKRLQMGKAGRQRVLENFTADTVAERTALLYETVLKGRAEACATELHAGVADRGSQ